MISIPNRRLCLSMSYILCPLELVWVKMQYTPIHVLGVYTCNALVHFYLDGMKDFYCIFFLTL